MSGFELLGHDCPLGRYPAPVVPIGRHEGELVAAYGGNGNGAFVPIEDGAAYVRHTPELTSALNAFDPASEHLFAFDATRVVKYSDTNEAQTFLSWLKDDDFSSANPFLRLSLAEATKVPEAIRPELVRCLEALPIGNPKLRNSWYAKQREALREAIPEGASLVLPEHWQEFLRTPKDSIYDVSTFKSEAPENPSLVKDLFCARKNELAHAIDVLRMNLDVGGKRAANRDKRPWVIQGDSRVGKSHFARRLMLELPQEKREQIVLLVREKLDAAMVMRMLFDELKNIYRRRASPRGSADLLQELEFFDVHSASAGLIARGCVQIVQSLTSDHGIEHVLILFDDVDLIEGYTDRNRNGRLQRAELSSAIAELVKTSGTDVLFTIRSWYAETVRECDDLVELEPMVDDDLVQIYEKRLSVFAPTRPLDFLGEDAIRKVAKDSKGLPGLLLRSLHIALNDYYLKEPQWDQRDYGWFMRTMGGHYEKMRKRLPDAAKALEEAIARGASSLNVESGNLFRNTAFENIFVYQSFYSETTLGVSPLAQAIIVSRQHAA